MAMELFAVDEEAIHHVGDARCPECIEEYPETCACGGLIHAESRGLEDEDGNPWVQTRCDQCRRAQEDVEEDLGREPV
jgi:hypothetical protein